MKLINSLLRPYIDIILWLLIQFIVSCIINILPKHCFSPTGFLYRCREWEKEGNIYSQYLRVKQWKNKLPVGISYKKGDINLKELKSRDPIHIKNYIIKSCKAETIHSFSILVIGLFFILYRIEVTIIYLLLTIAINLPYIIIHRYNRHRLIRLLSNINKK